MGDNDFPVRMAGQNLGGWHQEYVQGSNQYTQAGTHIPDYSQRMSYQQNAGGPLLIAGDQKYYGDPYYKEPTGNSGGHLTDPEKLRIEHNKIRKLLGLPLKEA